MDNNKSRKLALGAIFVAVTGYIAGILTAPKSGKETRRDIVDNAENTKLEIEKKLKASHVELKNVINEAQAMIKVEAKEIKKEASVVLKKAKNAESKVKETLSALHEGTADDPELNEALKEAQEALKHFKKFVTTNKNN